MSFGQISFNLRKSMQRRYGGSSPGFGANTPGKPHSDCTGLMIPSFANPPIGFCAASLLTGDASSSRRWNYNSAGAGLVRAFDSRLAVCELLASHNTQILACFSDQLG